MCLIIHKPKGQRIPVDIIQRAKLVNPHGFGITYLDTGETRKLFKYDLVDKILATPRPIVAHFRFATVGTIDTNNIHPFHIDKDTVIFSNGTVEGYGTKTTSDIAHIADRVLPKMYRSDWVPFLELTDTRFAIIDLTSGKVQRVGKWHQRGGIYYSKANCFPQNLRVGVYGTLKTGYSNHRLLKNADFVGTGKTKDPYPLEVDGLPYLHDIEGVGESVMLEIYDVNPATLEGLDRLEGHPEFYKRRVIPVSMYDWSTTYAWVYFIQDRDLYEDTELLDAYRGTRSRTLAL
tara:strand:+ start:172 stop:1041 length:870 start_codon:yes stop_codon:yes gene_type:complete